jgi:hypothetical protein
VCPAKRRQLRGIRPRSLRKNLLADHGDHC